MESEGWGRVRGEVGKDEWWCQFQYEFSGLTEPKKFQNWPNIQIAHEWLGIAEKHQLGKTRGIIEKMIESDICRKANIKGLILFP